jgi:predicted RNA binding protein YcfA (HicA-like mRNA interferase family)
MTLPRGVTARRLIAALHRDGFKLTRTTGAHRIYRHADGRRVVVGYHRLSDGFPRGTLAGMIAEVGWTDEDLKKLGLLAD